MNFTSRLKKPFYIPERDITISTDVTWEGKIYCPDPDMPEPYEQYTWSTKCTVDGEKYGYFHEYIKTHEEAISSIKQEFIIIEE